MKWMSEVGLGFWVSSWFYIPTLQCNEKKKCCE